MRWRGFYYLASTFTLLILSSVSGRAQIDLQFGQELLPPETQESAFESDLTIDYQASTVFNDHIEFGLSIDPNTSGLAGREDPQLQGVINVAGVNLQGTLPFGKRFGLKLQYFPQLENYIGETGQLNEFDAFTDLFLTELSFRPNSQLPALNLAHQLRRLDRKDESFDSLERLIRFQFGKLLEYNLRVVRFDDDQTRREDFLLVGSTSHSGRTQVQLGLLKNIIGKLEYSIEREAYKDNLNSLVLGVAGIEVGESRTDVRHLASAKLLQVPLRSVVLQEEFNLFFNNSDIEFYKFSTVELAAGLFYKINTDSWARLRVFRLFIDYAGRQVRGGDGFIDEGAPDREDKQWGMNVQLNWKFSEGLTLVADYQLNENRTNETAEIFDFLNYTNNIATLTVKGGY